MLPPNIDDVPPPGLALVEELDKLLLVQVRLPLLPPPPAPSCRCCLAHTGRSCCCTSGVCIPRSVDKSPLPSFCAFTAWPAVARRAQDCGHAVLL